MVIEHNFTQKCTLIINNKCRAKQQTSVIYLHICKGGCWRFGNANSVINLPFGYWATEVVQARMLRWVMEHSDFKLDFDFRQQKNTLVGSRNFPPKMYTFITEPFGGRYVPLSLFEASAPGITQKRFLYSFQIFQIHHPIKSPITELPFSHFLKSYFH